MIKNPVHHGIVKMPSDYKWCSSSWFERHADSAFYRTVKNFPCDDIEIDDDY